MAQLPTVNTSSNTLTMMLFNIRSFSMNKANLFGYIKDLNIKPDIIVLTETWIRENYLFSSPGYNAIHNYRDDGYGGVSILVKKGLTFTGLNVDYLPRLDAQFLSMKISNITILAAYIPPNVNVSTEQWNNIFLDTERPCIVLGDFNAHHSSWGCLYNDGKGNSLANAIEDVDFCNLNDGKPTLLTRPGQRESVIDLVFCSDDITLRCSSHTLEDTLGSNHFPVWVNIGLNLPLQCKKQFKENKFNCRKADWNRFSEVMSAELGSNTLLLTYEDFCSCVLSSANASIPRVKRNRTKYNPCPWWDDECGRIIGLRKQLIRRYKSSKSMEAFMIANRYIALSKKILNRKKRSYFKTFCESLNRDSAISEVWRSVRRLSRTFFENNQDTSSMLGELSENFLMTLAPSYVPQNVVPFQGELIINHLSVKISLNELKGIISTVKDSAPGIDNITYSMISHFPEDALKFLVLLFNKILSGHDIPNCWKKTGIYPILKPGRDPRDYRNYRPIALTSCIRKVFEKILLARLEWWCEHHLMFDRHQFGFRRSKSTMDNFTILVSDIYSAFYERKSVLAVFLDISSAYDNVIPEILVKKLKGLGIHSSLVNCIWQLIHEKIICLTNNTDYTRHAYKGLPQGSVLSPILFNLYLSGIEDILGPNFKLLQYADDIVFYLQGTDVIDIAQNISCALGRVGTWLHNLGLSISPPKTKMILFSRKRVGMVVPNIYYENHLVRCLPNVHYLGMLLDKKLNWKLHINHLVASCNKSINLMKCLCSTRWGADPSTLVTLYRGIIRSRLDYGCFLYTSCAETSFRRVERIQFQSIRVALGALHSSPTNALQVEAGEEPLRIRFKFLGEKFFIKSLRISNNPVCSSLNSLAQVSGRRATYRIIPFFLSCYKDILPVSDIVDSNLMLDIFRCDLQVNQKVASVIAIPSDILKQSVNPYAFNSLVNGYLKDRFPDSALYFTDGSRISPNDFSSYGVFSPTYNLKIAGCLPQLSSVFTAELVAIKMAVSHILSTKAKSNIILSDSESAIKDIVSIKPNLGNYITFKVRESIVMAASLNISISLCWIPSHKGLKGNEIADQLAKVGRFRPHLAIPIPIEDVLTSRKAHKRITWQEFWTESSNVKGKYSADIQPLVSYVPWFKLLPFISRTFITTISRLRLNHNLSPVHLFRINLSDTPNCVCGQLGTVNHLLFNCSRTVDESNRLIRALIDLKQFPPFDVRCLLGTGSFDIYSLIVLFLKRNKILI